TRHPGHGHDAVAADARQQREDLRGPDKDRPLVPHGGQPLVRGDRLVGRGGVLPDPVPVPVPVAPGRAPVPPPGPLLATRRAWIPRVISAPRVGRRMPSRPRLPAPRVPPVLPRPVLGRTVLGLTARLGRPVGRRLLPSVLARPLRTFPRVL